MTGKEFIKEMLIEEIDYNKAIELSMEDLRLRGITSRNQIYDNETVLDEPIYPANAELYDEFVDTYGFDCMEYMLYIAKRIELQEA